MAIKLRRSNGANTHTNIPTCRTEPLPPEIATVPGPDVKIYWPLEELYPRILLTKSSDYAPLNILVANLYNVAFMAEKEKYQEQQRKGGYMTNQKLLKIEVNDFGADIMEFSPSAYGRDTTDMGTKVAEIRILPNTITLECRIMNSTHYNYLKILAPKIQAELLERFELDLPIAVLRCYV